MEFVFGSIIIDSTLSLMYSFFKKVFLSEYITKSTFINLVLNVSISETSILFITGYAFVIYLLIYPDNLFVRSFTTDEL